MTKAQLITCVSLAVAAGFGAGWWGRGMAPRAPEARPAGKTAALPPEPVAPVGTQVAAPQVPPATAESVGAGLKATLVPAELARLLADIGRLSADEALRVADDVRLRVNRGAVPREAGQTLLLAALCRVAELDPARGVAQLRGLRAMQTEAAAAVLSTLAAKDPASAARWLTGEMRDVLGEQKGDRLGRLLALRWAERDFDGALAWSAQQTGALHDSAVAGLVSAAFARDPEKAAELVATVTHEESRRLAQGQLLEAWTDRDPQRALELAGQGAFGAVNDAPELLFSKWARENLPESLSGAATLTGAERQRATREIAEAWAARDPAAAATWVAQLPVEATGTNTWMALAQTWGAADPEAASTWVLATPPGEGRDGAIIGLVDSQRERDSESAVAWAEQIQDAALRQRTLLGAWNRWRDKDAPAAEAWLARTPALTAAQKDAARRR